VDHFDLRAADSVRRRWRLLLEPQVVRNLCSVAGFPATDKLVRGLLPAAMLVLSRKIQEDAFGGAADARNQPQPCAEVLEVRKVGATTLLRVLVVDDHKDGADSLSMLVKVWGHAVRPAYDGATALEIAREYRPDVVFLDLAMPYMDGCQLARLLRRQACFTHTLLIAVTGFPDEAHRRLCEAAGFDQRLVKPVEPLVIERLLHLEKDRLAELSAVPGRSICREEGGCATRESPSQATKLTLL
jgi:CheY-like chemotaxis protein